jgi:hypothetical protein
MTSSCCSCHHAARTWPHWPPGPSNEAYLSSPHLEASPATTFRACSSPAPTRVKPQPAPAILSQESVHTTLSITHHTRKRPSTVLEPHMVLSLVVLLWLADRPPGDRGPSAPGSRTVCQGSRRVAKSFASWFVLPFQDRSGFVPRVGRSAVTTWPWQTRVEILGCEFGV